MKLSEFKKALKKVEKITFCLPNGKNVPPHFHITEVGLISKKYIDCGGTVRTDNKVSFQIWEAEDYDHRLSPEKLLHIIEISEKQLGIPDEEIEIEYQGVFTIEHYSPDFDGEKFILVPLQTDCLAKGKCGIPEKPKAKLSEIQNACCAPGSGCC